MTKYFKTHKANPQKGLLLMVLMIKMLIHLITFVVCFFFGGGIHILTGSLSDFLGNVK